MVEVGRGLVDGVVLRSAPPLELQSQAIAFQLFLMGASQVPVPQRRVRGSRFLSISWQVFSISALNISTASISF